MAETKKVVLAPDSSDQLPVAQAPEQPVKKYALDYAPLGEKNLIGGRYVVEGRLVDAEGNPVNEGK